MENPFLKYFFTGVTTFCIGFLVATYVPAYSKIVTIVNSSVPFVETDKRDLDDLPTQNLGEAYRAIKENYYGFSTLQKDTIVEGMIKGMMESLKDKHSLYFDPSETQEFNQTIK